MASWRPASPTARRPSVATLGGERHEGAPEVSRARWLGVALVVLSLLAAILLAATAPTPGSTEPGVGAALEPSDAPTPSPSLTLPNGGVPSETPVILPPGSSLTKDPLLDLIVSVPELELKPKDVRLHIFRDGKVIAKRRARGPEVTVPDLKLKVGRNTLTAALVGPGGQGPVSDPVVITLDSVAPEVRIDAPRDGQSFETGSTTVRGSTEPGALVTVANAAGGTPYTLTAGPDGAFRVPVRLASGTNRITVRAEDDLGNARTIRLSVTRGVFVATVKLKLSPRSMRIARLPTRLKITLTVKDSKGDPVNRAPVVFTLGPYGQPGDNYSTETKDGRAVWAKNILRDGALRGQGKVTATVTLPDGREILRWADLEFT